MSSHGPKGPSDRPTVARVLPFRRPEPTAPASSSTVQGPSPVPGAVTPPPAAQAAAKFEPVPGRSAAVQAPVEGAALSQLVARLRALGPVESQAPVGPALVQTSEGPVLSGSVQLDGKAQLPTVEGVVRVGGDLAVTGVLKSADLLALRDLKFVEGRLTFESLSSKPPVEPSRG